MTSDQCESCCSQKLRPATRFYRDYLLALLGLRPMRCVHCFKRQYQVSSPILAFILRCLDHVDAAVNLLDPHNWHDRSTGFRQKTDARSSGRRDH